MQSYTPVYHGLLCLAVLAACNGAATDTDSDTAVEPPAVDPVCTEATAPPCVDEMFSDLSLHDDKVARDAEVTTRVDGTDYVTAIDATAGGFESATQNPWVYVKFTDDGAERVNLNDEKALESLDWDLAARRFVLRLNGGTSGPSCVGAMPFLEKSYEEVTEVPDDAIYALDDFYTSDCTIINEASGLEGSPQVALSKWWHYPIGPSGGCVATTGVPFLVQLADGHVIKLVVEQYYLTGQAGCNNDSNVGSDGANLEIRWTYLQ
jgi:hypothetical protein